MAWTVPNNFANIPYLPAIVAAPAPPDSSTADKLAAMQSAIDSKASASDVSAVSAAVARKADATAVTTALGNKADADAVGQTLSGLQTGLAGKADASAIPKPASSMPSPEAVAPAKGSSERFALEDHTHERLASATYGVTNIQTGITDAIMFTRPFPNMPCVIPSVVKNPGALATAEVYDWIMGSGAKAGKYVGCYIIAKRQRTKVTNTAVVVLGISVLQKQDAIIEEYPAGGLNISITAVARSDMA